MKLKLKALPTFSLLAVVIGATACATSADPAADGGTGGDSSVPVGDGGAAPVAGTGGAPAGSGGGTSTGGLTFGAGGSEPLEVEAYLPATVTDYFAPAGFMGQENAAAMPAAPDEVEGITMDEAGCTEEDRPEGAVGECFKVTYEPQYLNPCGANSPDGCTDGSTWAGVYFTSFKDVPEGDANWGEYAGTVIEQGATKIVFTAWTDGEEYDLEFIAGGIGNIGTAYADTFKASSSATVGPTPMEFSIDLSGQNYEMVLGGFCWVIEALSADPVVFYVDDIRWVKE